MVHKENYEFTTEGSEAPDKERQEGKNTTHHHLQCLGSTLWIGCLCHQDLETEGIVAMLVALFSASLMSWHSNSCATACSEHTLKSANADRKVRDTI